MSELSNYDLRQFRLLQKNLLLFESKKIGLHELIQNLNSLVNALENISESWVSNFQSKINLLELIDNSIADNSISRWQGNHKDDLHKTVSKLRQMTFLVIDRYLKTPNTKITETAIEGNSKWLICPYCNDAWESASSDAMVVCPKCEHVSHNPRFKE